MPRTYVSSKGSQRCGEIPPQNSKADAERIREKILSLKDPFIVKPRKVKGEENTFRLRVGDYRILFFIDEEQKIVTVSKVDKRSRIYDRL